MPHFFMSKGLFFISLIAAEIFDLFNNLQGDDKALEIFLLQLGNILTKIESPLDLFPFSVASKLKHKDDTYAFNYYLLIETILFPFGRKKP